MSLGGLDRTMEPETLEKAGCSEWASNRMKGEPPMELRDFFRDLTFAEFAAHMNAKHAGRGDPRTASRAIDEMAHTQIEAERAIPILKHVNVLRHKAMQEKDQRTFDSLGGVADVLEAVYRMAEDMGYEW